MGGLNFFDLNIIDLTGHEKTLKKQIFGFEIFNGLNNLNS